MKCKSDMLFLVSRINLVTIPNRQSTFKGKPSLANGEAGHGATAGDSRWREAGIRPDEDDCA